VRSPDRTQTTAGAARPPHFERPPSTFQAGALVAIAYA
jgi:hypothetical protein